MSSSVPNGYRKASAEVTFSAPFTKLTTSRRQTIAEHWFYTASAYLATIAWLFAAIALLSSWLTVLCIFWILASLLGAFIQFIKNRTSFIPAELFCVVQPVGIFMRWITVASIANVATALASSGFSNILFPNQIWAIIMLSIGVLIASFITRRSRGQVSYTLTVI